MSAKVNEHRRCINDGRGFLPAGARTRQVAHQSPELGLPRGLVATLPPAPDGAQASPPQVTPSALSSERQEDTGEGPSCCPLHWRRDLLGQ